MSVDRLMDAMDLLNSTGQLESKVIFFPFLLCFGSSQLHELIFQTGLTLVTYYEGLPRDLRPRVGMVHGTVWETNRDLLIVVIVLAILIVLIIIIGICCIKCKGDGGEKVDISLLCIAAIPKRLIAFFHYSQNACLTLRRAKRRKRRLHPLSSRIQSQMRKSHETRHPCWSAPTPPTHPTAAVSICPGMTRMASLSLWTS